MTHHALAAFVTPFDHRENEIVDEDGDQSDGETDGRSVRVDLVREPRVVLDLLRLGHTQPGALHGVRHHVVGALREEGGSDTKIDASERTESVVATDKQTRTEGKHLIACYYSLRSWRGKFAAMARASLVETNHHDPFAVMVRVRHK